ncbi:MAG TPA: AMIN domain-containing protein, partial [Terricaulis sp.]|nr:AMIN domain-containing protein [Terricaulis sp.]
MVMTRRSFALFGATALGSAALTGRAYANAPALLRGVAVEASGASARVSLALDKAARARTMFLAEPHRFVIDVADAMWAMPQGASGAG